MNLKPMNLQSQIIINAELNPSLFIQHPQNIPRINEEHATHQPKARLASTKYQTNVR